jgi:hypothetical protein
VKRLDGEGGSDFEVPKYLVPTSQALGWGAEAVSWIEWMSWTKIRGGVYAVSSKRVPCVLVPHGLVPVLYQTLERLWGSD